MSDYAQVQEQLNQALLYIGQLEEGIGNAAAKMPPVNRDVPVVSGTGIVGSALSCTMGNWYAMGGSGAEYHYAWSGGGASLGTDAASYTPVAGDEGKQVSCVVTAVNGAGTVAAPSSNAVEILPAGTQAAAASAKPAAEPAAAHERNRGR